MDVPFLACNTQLGENSSSMQQGQGLFNRQDRRMDDDQQLRYSDAETRDLITKPMAS